MSNRTQFEVRAVSPSYWKVTFENGPINLIAIRTPSISLAIW
ncbi:hypothetical protein LJR290_006359 [Variovorax sp. LjRoot290]